MAAADEVVAAGCDLLRHLGPLNRTRRRAPRRAPERGSKPETVALRLRLQCDRLLDEENDADAEMELPCEAACTYALRAIGPQVRSVRSHVNGIRARLARSSHRHEYGAAGPEVVLFCPACAAREFGLPSHAAESEDD